LNKCKGQLFFQSNSQESCAATNPPKRFRTTSNPCAQAGVP
jgi:hypothetical protein